MGLPMLSKNRYWVSTKLIQVLDNFWRIEPFRKGKTNVALGIAGLKALATMQGTKDFYGREVQSSPIAIADEIVGADNLHESAGNCLVLVRGLPSSYRQREGLDIVRKQSEDLFGN